MEALGNILYLMYVCASTYALTCAYCEEEVGICMDIHVAMYVCVSICMYGYVWVCMGMYVGRQVGR